MSHKHWLMIAGVALLGWYLFVHKKTKKAA